MENKSRDIVVVGGCGWDCTFYEKEDGTYGLEPDKESPGSKGANQAVGCARAGASVKIITTIGDVKKDSFSAKILNNLVRNNIDTTGVWQVRDGLSDVAKIYVDKDGNNKMDRITGAINELKPKVLTEVPKNKAMIENAGCVVFQSKMPRETYMKLVDMCYESGVPTVLTPCPFKDLTLNGENAQENREILDKVTYITANKEEALALAGLPKTAEVEEAMEILGNLVVTDGVRGVYFRDENGVIQNSPALKADNIVDKTGAGDAFASYFTAGLVEYGMSMAEAVEFGIKASTLNIQKKGAQEGMPTVEQVNSTQFEVELDTSSYKHVESYFDPNKEENKPKPIAASMEAPDGVMGE